jgi:hypothetical protein
MSKMLQTLYVLCFVLYLLSLFWHSAQPGRQSYQLYTPEALYPPGKFLDTHFCYRLSKPPGLLNAERRNKSLEKFKEPYQKSNPEPPIFWRSALTNYSALSLTSTLEGRGGQSPRIIPYPLYKMLGGSQGSSAQVLKISTPTGYVPWTLKAVVRRICVVQEVNSLA